MMISVQPFRTGVPSIAVLPWTTIAYILSMIQSVACRNRTSEVCRAFRLHERQSRTSLALRGLQRHLGLVPRCFSYVTNLDLSTLTLLPSDVPCFPPEKIHQVRLARAFPNVRNLKVMTVNDESIKILGRIWPDVENLAFVNRGDVQTHPQLQTVLETFRRIKDLDARNLSCDNLTLTMNKFESLQLQSLNLETIPVWKDLDLEIVAKASTRLESLCITIHLRQFTGKGFLTLANHCRNLRKLRLFLYIGSERDFGAESARRCLQTLVKMVAEFPDIQLHISLGHIPSSITGLRMDCLLGMGANIRSLVLYFLDTEIRGILSCKNLTEVTFGSCESLGDQDLLNAVNACPQLTTLRILDCKRVTDRGLAQVAQAATLTSLSLCFLKIRVKAMLNAIKPMSRSLTALRLMVNNSVDSLSGLSGWPHLHRLDLTLTSNIKAEVFSELWLESCPNLKHLGIVIQNWCPSSLGFLTLSSTLPSLSITFTTRVPKNVLLSLLEDITVLPLLASLALYICNEDWLTEDAGAVIAKCPKLNTLNIIWTSNQLVIEDFEFGLRPFLIKVLNMKCLQNVQLPCSRSDENDMRIFYRGLHAHTMYSLLKSIYDLKAREEFGSSLPRRL
ncbi:hypothetical protein Mapa_010722 [Marchantia paleacea]|nr:hypothetical protein Mapa_010722 [Marchantia paleacea]